MPSRAEALPKPKRIFIPLDLDHKKPGGTGIERYTQVHDEPKSICADARASFSGAVLEVVPTTEPARLVQNVSYC